MYSNFPLSMIVPLISIRCSLSSNFLCISHESPISLSPIDWTDGLGSLDHQVDASNRPLRPGCIAQVLKWKSGYKKKKKTCWWNMPIRKLSNQVSAIFSQNQGKIGNTGGKSIQNLELNTGNHRTFAWVLKPQCFSRATNDVLRCCEVNSLTYHSESDWIPEIESFNTKNKRIFEGPWMSLCKLQMASDSIK